jgi:hypothetical protein
MPYGEYQMNESERAVMGQGYLIAAEKCGFIDIAPAMKLYSAAGIKKLGMKNAEGEPFKAEAGEFFFFGEHIISVCYGALNVMDFLDHIDEKEHRRADDVFDLQYKP